MTERDGRSGEREGEVAVLAGGCFWCLEPVFEELRGVESVEPGYTGGTDPNPTYRAVCEGGTGHAEAVRIVFDPRVVSYRELLEVFFTIHDPTTLDRQGNDVGSQYRSAIFWGSPEQRETAASVIQDLVEEGLWSDPVVTELAPLGTFHPAEPYHREYFRNNPEQAYCRLIIAPKVQKFRKRFLARLREGA